MSDKPDPSLIEVLFPTSGVDTSGEYGIQRPNTTPRGVNVRANDPILERNRGGARHGLAKYPTEQIPEGSELIQHLNQLVILNTDYLLTTFEDFRPDFVPDPSTNNNSTRNPGRDIPPTGSGVPPNRNRPSDPRRRVALVASVPEATDGDTVTLTSTLTRESAGTVVAGQTIILQTQPAGKDGHGDTAVTDVAGQVQFTVSEPTFEGQIRYIAYHEYTPPV